MKIALVYDRVNKFGGAERVLQALHKIWPKAPLYTSVYNPSTAPWADDFQVIPSFLQKFPFARKHHQFYPWLMPLAFESFNFSKFNVVISVTSEAAKGIITQPDTLHICYCLTPTRYLWSGYQHYSDNPCYGILNPLAKIFMKPVLSYLRKWDQTASQRPDYFISISQEVKNRIKKYYHRDSEIIYPSVDIEKFSVPIKNRLEKPVAEKYYLVVSRLESYKRIDIIIEAFNQLGYPLKIIGDGRERRKLQRTSEKNIQFLGQNLTDDQLLSYYQNCCALIFSGKEDFGLVSLEAQACGKPVIAYKEGGLKETVVDRQTGILFFPQSKDALKKAVEQFRKWYYNPSVCRSNAEKFSEKIFVKNFKKKVEELWRNRRKK